MADDRDSSSSAEVSDSGSDSVDSADVNLCTESADQELVTTDYSGYEAELMDFSYDTDVAQTDKTPVHNVNGEEISGIPEVREEDYLKDPLDLPENDERRALYCEYGIKTTPDYSRFARNSDDMGFDKGSPIDTHSFKEGDRFSRYGGEKIGRYASDIGTEYSKLSLPNKEETVEYHEYKVSKSFECTKGTVAPNFHQEGGGTQYVFNKTISEMLKDGTIERIK